MRLVRKEKRGAPGTFGYCCPRCHTWYPTPAARKECRDEHRRAAEAEAARKAAA